MQPGIRIVALAGDSFAVGTVLVGKALAREQVSDRSAHQRHALSPQKMAKPLIAAQNPEFPIVHQNRIADRIEGIHPLLLRGRHLFE